MRPRRGFVTQLGMDHAEAVEFAGAEGFDFVELMLDGAGDHRRLADRGDEVRRWVADADVDLLVHLPFGSVDLGTPLSHVREGSITELVAAVETAAELGAEKAVCHASTGAWRPAWDDADVREALFDSVRRLDERGRELGVEVCVENVPRGVFTTHDFPALFDATDASMTLDTGHARMDGRDSGGIASFVDDHADRISHVHLNDTRGPSDEHLPFGAGTLDFEAILGAFPDDWEGTLSLEVYTLEYDYVAASREHLDALL